MMIWPLCRLCSIANNVSEVKQDGPVGTGAGKGVGAEAGAGEGAEVRRVEDEGAYDLLPLVFRVPQKVTKGSSRFQ